jgi:hypothetical protein
MSDLDLSNPYDPDQFPKEVRKPASVPLRPLSNADEIAQAPASPGSPPPSEPAAADPQAPLATPPAPAAGPSTWKAAASSVPKLRQQPAALPEPSAADGEFQGFAQDVPQPRRAGDEEMRGEGRVQARARAHASPSRPAPDMGGRLAAARHPQSDGVRRGDRDPARRDQLLVLIPHGEPSIPLARIRQHPEAFDGRVVKVNGRAGETFTVGGSFVFDLRQGRDTIVVYSSRRPSLHQRVEATGTLSIGYLDGAPRLALFEQPQTP